MRWRQVFPLLLFFTFTLVISKSDAQEVSQSGRRLEAARPMISQPERAPKAMVATVNEISTQVGLDVLQRGGNAVDAAVAIAFALAVVHPEAGNIGGGGYLLVRMADGRAKVIDYRETAPGVSRPGMFANEMEARVGYKASAVPGTVAGMEMAHKMFGSKSWRDVLEPARQLAAKGFPAPQRMEIILALQVPVMKPFAETAKVFLHGSDKPLKQGELLRQPDLAATISRIQKHGAAEFYTGETARLIAADMAANGGTITSEDLKNYKAIDRDPISSSYRGYPVLACPPSTSGGMALLEMLNVLEKFKIELGREGSAEVRHLMIEAMRRAYRDRAEFAADPAFSDVPVARLISKEYATEIAANISRERATPSRQLQPPRDSVTPNEGYDTTHFAIVDAAGNVVTNTYTLNSFFGSQVIPKGTGVLLNDIMSGFGRNGPNVVAPGKRPVSSMTPVIVLGSDNKPWFALGSPGASTIPNTVFQIVVNIIDFKMSLRDAIEFPRIHHQYLPDRVDSEPAAIVYDVAERLRSMGHTINPVMRSQGDVHAVMIDPKDGWRIGWSDGRRGGKALGY